MTPRPDVSIIIVSWNTRALTTACLASLPAAARAFTWDTWVIDNASGDGSVDAIRAAFPGVQLIANTGNLGFAAANNQGIRRSNGRYVLLLNSDTLMTPGSLDRLVAFADATPRAGVIGGRLLNPDGTFQSGPTPFPSIWNELLSATGLGVRLTFRGYPSRADRSSRQPQRTDYVGGACLCARRDAIDDVGLLDEHYFMYSEEPDWCWRMHRAGWETWFTPDVEVTHFGGQSTKQLRDAMYVALYRSKARFFRLHRGRVAATVVAALFVAVSRARRLVRAAAGIRPAGVALGFKDLRATDDVHPPA